MKTGPFMLFMEAQVALMLDLIAGTAVAQHHPIHVTDKP
jgi:hypothetical protein